jgi:hypothetical protein
MTLAGLRKWWKSRRRRPLNELLAVEFDDNEVRVRVLDGLEPAWNQTFLWSDITRVCFKEEGLWSSDNLFLTLRGQEKVSVVPTEAKGGTEFFGALCERGLFPEEVRRKAIGDTSGGTHCWPPFGK